MGMNCCWGGASAAVELGKFVELVVIPLDKGKFNIDDNGHSSSEVNSLEWVIGSFPSVFLIVS